MTSIQLENARTAPAATTSEQTRYVIGARLEIGDRTVDVRGEIVAVPVLFPSRDTLLRGLMTRRVG